MSVCGYWRVCACVFSVWGEGGSTPAPLWIGLQPSANVPPSPPKSPLPQPLALASKLVTAAAARKTSAALLHRHFLSTTSSSTHTTTTSTALRAAGDGEDDGSSATEEAGPLGVAAAGLGLVACPVVFWSEWTLKTTGCGLPAGPGGALGALEGISYLVVAGVFLWSIATKVRTGKGLPGTLESVGAGQMLVAAQRNPTHPTTQKYTAGPAGLLGAVEGMSFLAVVAGVVIAGLTYADYGSIPEAVPVDGGRCSNI